MTNKMEGGWLVHYPNESVLTDHLYVRSAELVILDCVEMPLMGYTIGSTSRDFWEKR